MEKSNDSSKKTDRQATTGKQAVTPEKKPAESDVAKKKPDAEKAKAPAKKAASKAATPKAAAPKVAPSKVAPPKAEASKPAASKPATDKVAVVQPATPAKADAAPKQAAADTGKKPKGAFAKKMDEVKNTATMIGHKIAEVAKDANKKSETFEDAIAIELHVMKKDIHKLAVNVAEKTKE